MFSDKFLSSEKFQKNNEFLSEYAIWYVNALKVIKGMVDDEITMGIYDKIQELYESKSEESIEIMKKAFWSTLRNPNLDYEQKSEWYLLMSKMNDDQLFKLYSTNLMETSKLQEIDELSTLEREAERATEAVKIKKSSIGLN